MGQTVELYTAWFWICPGCGKRNFTTGVDPEMSAEDEAKVKQAMRIEPWESGSLTLVPEEVKCEGCNGKYEVSLEQEEDDF